MHWQEACEQLRLARERNERCSGRIVELWLTCLRPHVDSLGSEKWPVLEQVCVAALDAHNMDVAEFCLLSLARQFPGSVRVRKLKAQRLEALERFDDARAIYEAILTTDETNLSVRKRLVAIHKAQGDTVQAISQLVDYLNQY